MLYLVLILAFMGVSAVALLIIAVIACLLYRKLKKAPFLIRVHAEIPLQLVIQNVQEQPAVIPKKPKPKRTMKLVKEHKGGAVTKEPPNGTIVDEENEDLEKDQGSANHSTSDVDEIMVKAYDKAEGPEREWAYYRGVIVACSNRELLQNGTEKKPVFTPQEHGFYMVIGESLYINPEYIPFTMGLAQDHRLTDCFSFSGENEEYSNYIRSITGGTVKKEGGEYLLAKNGRIVMR